MARPAITWVITDTHFYHDFLIKEQHRPPTFNEKIIGNCRRLIAKQDLLIHLGDVILYRYHELQQILDSFPCRKVLTMGNHDRKSRGWYQAHGFDLAVDSFVLDDILFSHKPIRALPSDAGLNIHGHFHNTVHRLDEYASWYTTETHRLLAIENTNYEPVRLDHFVTKDDRRRISERLESVRNAGRTEPVPDQPTGLP